MLNFFFLFYPEHRFFISLKSFMNIVFSLTARNKSNIILYKQLMKAANAKSFEVGDACQAKSGIL